MYAIEVAGLSKRYGKIEALRGVNLRVPEGAVFGLVGPNGAGKTTLIKALVGTLRPYSGEMKVLGLAPHKDRNELRRRIGYMPQLPALYDDLPAHDNVEFFGAAHRPHDLRRRVAEVLQLTDLVNRAKEPVHAFSGGMKRRVSLACTLVHRPEMLLLDEPTAAVDPQLRSRLWKTFQRMAKDGATLFISTHSMDEAMLCDRIAILRKGQIIASDTPRRIPQWGRPVYSSTVAARRKRRSSAGIPRILPPRYAPTASLQRSPL
jgi:ABC-2 type transport system ATP-binding protein